MDARYVSLRLSPCTLPLVAWPGTPKWMCLVRRDSFQIYGGHAMFDNAEMPVELALRTTTQQGKLEQSAAGSLGAVWSSRLDHCG